MATKSNYPIAHGPCRDQTPPSVRIFLYIFCNYIPLQYDPVTMIKYRLYLPEIVRTRNSFEVRVDSLRPVPTAGYNTKNLEKYYAIC